MTKVVFEGHTLDARTRDMVIALRVICDAPVVITQGSYSTSVGASAGTHSGGGAVDIRLKDRTTAERKEIETKSRKVGFAGWIRTPEEGNWPWHCHMIAIGCPDLSAGAANQVVDYHEGRNGLANNRADTGTRSYVGMTWEKYKKQYPDLLTEDQMTPAQMTELKNFIEARVKAYAGFDAKNTEQQLRTLLANVEDVTQRYAVAVEGFVQQVDNSTQSDLTVAVGGVKADVATLSKAVAVLTAKVDALPKA